MNSQKSPQQNGVPTCSWWHSPAVAVDSLEAVRTTAQCLEDGQPVPADAAKLVSAAFRRYLAGEYDITRNLGLRPRRGGRHETPVAIERTERRNTFIKNLADQQDGPKTHRCETVAQLLKAPPNETRVTDFEVSESIRKFREEFGDDLPTSTRQIVRIVDGK